MVESSFKDRQHPRISSLNLVSYTHYDEQGKPDFEDLGRTKDLSEGGILLECNRSFSVGTELEVHVAIHDELITARGKITRVDPVPNSNKCDIGVRFVTISKEDESRIDRFLTEEIT